MGSQDYGKSRDQSEIFVQQSHWLRVQVSGVESRGVKLGPIAKCELKGLSPGIQAGGECAI